MIQAEMPDTDENNPQKPQFVEVALPLPLQGTFTYRLPYSFRDIVRPGARLLVPFGKRRLTGYATAFHATFEPHDDLDESHIKDVLELLDEEPLVTEEILELTKWTADYYASSWGEVLKASLPAGINAATENIFALTEPGRIALFEAAVIKGVKWEVLGFLSENGETSQKNLERFFGEAAFRRVLRELTAAEYVSVGSQSVTAKVKPKLRKAVKLIAATASGESKPLTDAQQKILDTLSANGGEMLFTELLEIAEIGASPINTLAKRGLVEVSTQEVFRDPLNEVALPELQKIRLNAEQKFVLNEIEKALESKPYKAFLLHGVTGSGKTEVYIRAMRSALDKGLSSLMLVPEISLTPIFSRRLRAVFGEDVAILHSNLGPGERFDEWRRIRSGAARIAIGTRSAVFAPLRDLGLVIVDEEHDTSYRQHETPFYHARDVAVMRANSAGVTVVLGSATPAMESFHNAQSGKYQYLQLRNRIGGRPLAKAELIDMREVFRKAGKDVVLSPKLAEAIDETHSKGEQSIVLLNRRGFSSFVLCRTCGERLRCKNCDITMTYHRGDNRLVCHYCNYTVKTPKECPFCESEYLYFIGQGTEQIEELLHKRFSHLRIARIDRDTMSRKGEMAKTLLAFDKGEIDMLVGTQMLAKGHDFHNVTLVGVISVDIGLGLPDLRSAERTFQLLTQVAGRAGRGSLPGRVLIQTYYPEHYALRHAAEQDFEGFYEEEIRYRQRLSYPPFVVLASILVKHRDQNYALKSAKLLRESLDRANADKGVRVLGPAPASISKLKNEYRYQIVLKSANRKTLRSTIDRGVAEAETRGCDKRIVAIEIDPVNLM